MSASAPAYVPVLRWKPAERRALYDLKPSTRANVTPLIEVIPKYVRSRSSLDFAQSFTKELVGHWGQRPHFVCFGHVHAPFSNEHQELIRDFAKASVDRGLVVTPVLRPSFGNERELLAAFGPVIELNSFAMRVTRDDLVDSRFIGLLTLLKQRTAVPLDKVDLILDFRLLDGPVQMTKTFALLETLVDWSSITYLAGSFPKDLSELQKNEQHVVSRVEWDSWLEAHGAQPAARFGDYTIQHPLFEEPPAYSNFSASIRYTTDRSWVVMRGEGVRNQTGPGFQQYPAQAQLLRIRPEFKGPSFSRGDWYIAEMAEQQRHSGSAQTWLRAGINHHMEFVVHQLVGRAAA